MKELLEFLIEKCQKGVEEAVEKCVDTQLKVELEEIRKVLNSGKGKILSCPSHGKTKNELYDLISMLTDITMSNKHPAQILCVPLQIRSRRQTRKNLREIRTHLDKSLNGKEEEGGPSETVSRRPICKILPCLKRSLGQGSKKNSSNQNGGSAEPADEGTQENSSSSGGKEVSSELEGLPEIEGKNILGFKALIKKIVSRLDFKNGRGHVEIGILGMCGSGKTTLARLIYSHSSVANDFEPRIWVSLPHIPASKPRDGKQILRFILKQCGDGVYQSTMDEYEKPQLLRAVRKNLLGKSYLLVLDGLWEADIKWYFELSRALDWQYKCGDFGDDGSKSAVILTSRLDDVAKTMVGISGLHQIHPLLDQETCWSIFINQVKSGSSKTPLENESIKKLENDIEQKEEIKELENELENDIELKKGIKELIKKLENDIELKEEIKKLKELIKKLENDIELKEEIKELIQKLENDIELKEEIKDLIKKLENDIELKEEIKELKEAIKKQCDGLPLAALTLAEIIPTLLKPPPQVAEEAAAGA